MFNPSKEKTYMPVQDANVRNKNFDEVSLGYDCNSAINEANRCLNCKNKPCVSGCPVGVKIPDFIGKIKEGKFEEAYEIINNTNALAAICGRVCPQENQCEKNCVRAKNGEAVAIGRLERFVADFHLNNSSDDNIKKVASKNQKVAVIGSGPAGLSCASELAKRGYQVTIFEALHLAGGVLVYGIPEFRLPKSIVQKQIDHLISLGVEIKTNVVIGKTITIEELKNTYNYKAIFIASGAGLPRFMNIENENANGVYSANEYLTRVNLMKAYKETSDTPIIKANKVAVVGGGNVAMDAARCAKRMGAKEVYIIYRRSKEEMPARQEEVEHALEEGIEFKFLTNPISIGKDSNNFVNKIRCVKMKLCEPDASNRRSPIVIENSEFDIEVDCVIMAIGTSPNPLIRNSLSDLKVEKWGGIIVDEETNATSIESIYAGGDAVTGSATVILAMGAGKKAADSIDKYLSLKK